MVGHSISVLGVQLVITLITLSVLNKLSLKYSIARWILSSLIRYLHPNNEQLRLSAGIQSPKQHKNGGHRKRRDATKEDNSFLVPKNADIALEAEKIKIIDLLQLQYYSEFQWLLDFAFCAFFVYVSSEVYVYFVPNNREFNLSIIWCSLVIAFCGKLMLSLTALYFRGGDEAMGERSMCIMSACMFFLVSMIVLITDENYLEFGLNNAYSSFNESAYKMLESHGMAETATGPASKLIFKFWLAVWCGLIGGFFTFPGLRYAQMHKDSLMYHSGNLKIQILLHIAFVSPMFITLFWVKPFARNYLTERTWGQRGILVNPANFDTLRIIIILLIVFLRLLLIRKYLQAYLNLAPRKLLRLKKEVGRIKNVELQKMIAQVFYYLCVVSLQYVGPVLMCLFSTLLMKTLGEYSWITFITGEQSEPFVPTITSSDFNLQSLKAIFNPILFRGVLGFMTWWMVTVWFATSVVGFVYHSYFSS
ncbi:transmembrane protein 161B-like protein [Leptotrombidium deliense]|uniref:Transmembrane protein 161B-like protein n=1 Tax=Leptotrombidium deliense TaxID=299467 RepID=A0A443SLJ1_9ACAR|nr:transmembrane protein 161B-like protein [Leptotrombidium deliense]